MKEKNEFQLTELLIDHTQIMGGCPLRDGIPSIDEPKFVNDLSFLSESNMVIGVAVEGVAKAYPIKMSLFTMNR